MNIEVENIVYSRFTAVGKLFSWNHARDIKINEYNVAHDYLHSSGLSD